MKALKIIAWVGFGFFAAGIAISVMIWMSPIWYTPGPYPTFGPSALWFYIIPLDILGLLLMYIGGLITRPRRLWLASIFIWGLHIVVSVPQEWNFLIRRIHERGMDGLIADISSNFVSPGLAAILLGVLLLLVDIFSRKRKKSSTVELPE